MTLHCLFFTGKISMKLFAAEAPKTVANFKALSLKGVFSPGCFYRAEPGFVLQGLYTLILISLLY